MIVEFLVACFLMPSADVKQAFIELLADILEDYGHDFEEDTVAEMVILRHLRVGSTVRNDNGATRQHTIIGFALELPENLESIESVIDGFAAELRDAEQGFHVLRFEDPVLRYELSRYSDEIFDLEMKLRRVLSFIYLHAYQNDEDAYNLLWDETVNPINSLRQQQMDRQQQMEFATENEFFHLYFSDYRDLNKRKNPNPNELIALIQSNEQYEILRNELTRTNTIDDTNDADLLADLKQHMNPIEAMRNCVAHYRRPSNTITNNYNNTRSALDERLNRYLDQWEI